MNLSNFAVAVGLVGSIVGGVLVAEDRYQNKMDAIEKQQSTESLVRSLAPDTNLRFAMDDFNALRQEEHRVLLESQRTPDSEELRSRLSAIRADMEFKRAEINQLRGSRNPSVVAPSVMPQY